MTNITMPSHSAHDYTDRGTRCAVSPSTNYGYWERKDGSEGGGLWFDGKELTDYDGAFELPRAVCLELQGMGYTVEDRFFPD